MILNELVYMLMINKWVFKFFCKQVVIDFSIAIQLDNTAKKQKSVCFLFYGVPHRDTSFQKGKKTNSTSVSSYFSLFPVFSKLIIVGPYNYIVWNHCGTIMRFYWFYETVHKKKVIICLFWKCGILSTNKIIKEYQWNGAQNNRLG